MSAENERHAEAVARWQAGMFMYLFAGVLFGCFTAAAATWFTLRAQDGWNATESANAVGVFGIFLSGLVLSVAGFNRNLARLEAAEDPA